MNNGNKTPLEIEAIEKETKTFVCPNCNIHLQFRTSVKILSVQPTLTGEELIEKRVAEQPESFKTPEQKVAEHQAHAERLRLARLVQFYKDSGILDAFLDVARELKAHQMPKNAEMFFLNWIRATTKAQLIPKFALRKLINEFNDGQIEVHHAQGIGAIISDGTLRAFVPMHLLRGEVIRAGGGSNTKLRTLATDAGMDNWIRTKHGYVVGTGAMFSELKKQAKGSFELTVK